MTTKQVQLTKFAISPIKKTPFFKLRMKSGPPGTHTSWSCIEVLHVFGSCLTLFASFYMMHIKFYMHEILTAAGNFYNFFPCNIENPNAVDIFHFLQNFPCTFPNITCNQNLVIAVIYSFHGFVLCPLKIFICKRCFSLGKNRTF